MQPSDGEKKAATPMLFFKTVALLVAFGLLGTSCSGFRFNHLSDAAWIVTIILVVTALIGSVWVDLSIERRSKKSTPLLPPNLEQVARAHFTPSLPLPAETSQDNRIEQPGQSSPGPEQPEEE